MKYICFCFHGVLVKLGWIVFLKQMSRKRALDNNYSNNNNDDIGEPSNKRLRMMSFPAYDSYASLSNMDNGILTNIINNIHNRDIYDDVDFIIGNDDNLKIISGIKVLFAIQSEVLYRMLFNGNMFESVSYLSSKNNRHKVIINDIMPDAFEIFKEYCYAKMPYLSINNNIIDVLYISNKYLVYGLIKKCKNKILYETRQDINNWFKLLQQFEKYPPSTFESFLPKFFSNSKINSQEIINNKRFININIKFIQMYIKFGLFSSELEKYQTALKYCKKNKNKDEISIIMKNYFIHLIDFTKIDLDYLTIVVQKDNIFSDSQLLKIITRKVRQNLGFKIKNCLLTQLL